MGLMDSMLNRAVSTLSSSVQNKVRGGVERKLQAVGQGSQTPGCPKCKAKITDPSVRFCQKCGTKLFMTCAKCSKDYPTGTKFCTQCGSTLQ